MNSRPNPDVVSLFDVVPQNTIAQAPTWSKLEQEVPPHLSVALLTPGVALACWILVLDRIRGDSRVGIEHSTGWLALEVPVLGSLADRVSQVRRAMPQAVVNMPADADVAWAESTTAPSDVPSLIWLVAALATDKAGLALSWLTPPLLPIAVPALLGAWQQVIVLFVVNPDIALRRVAAMSTTQRERQLTALSADPWSHRGPLSVVACFNDAVARCGARKALAWSGGQWTYGELDAASRRMAGALLASGVAAGEVVAVGLPRSPLATASILGVLRAGAAYLPVDLAYPPERLRFMFTDAKARFLLRQGPESLDLGVTGLDLDSLPDSQGAPVRERDDDSLTYVMYTSGSTGQPKGVEICHRSIVRLVCGA